MWWINRCVKFRNKIWDNCKKVKEVTFYATRCRAVWGQWVRDMCENDWVTLIFFSHSLNNRQNTGYTRFVVIKSTLIRNLTLSILVCSLTRLCRDVRIQDNARYGVCRLNARVPIREYGGVKRPHPTIHNRHVYETSCEL